jgi:hypothetical protein
MLKNKGMVWDGIRHRMKEKRKKGIKKEHMLYYEINTVDVK